MSQTGTDDEQGQADGADPGPRTRPDRRVTLIAVAIVGVLVVGAAMGGWLVTRGHSRVTGEVAAQRFVDDYTASIDATYRLDGEFTRTMPDGRELRSGLLVVQRPPDRVQRSLGSTSGWIGGRLVNCGPTGADGGYQCAPGAAAEPFDEMRAEQLEALDQYVAGDDPVYAVIAEGSCYELVRRRDEPDASFGARTTMCFDRSTGALRNLGVHHDTGAIDRLVGVSVSASVSDADFDLSADDTYDPEGS
jgi:hypothetical protein